MKQLVLLALTISVLTSCGPHRMRCGPRGICMVTEKKEAKNNYNINNRIL